MFKQSHLMLPKWIYWTLLACGLHALSGAIIMIFVPDIAFKASGLESNSASLLLMQALGIMLAVNGTGYCVAVTNPIRHSIVIFLGLLTKILMTLGVLSVYWTNGLPFLVVLSTILNDFSWWIPLSIILYHVIRRQ